jgi:uncharacterized protein YbaR (Trm112 family)
VSLIDETLAAVLVCPADKSDLIEDVDSGQLVCTSCGRRYPVRDGIPIMLIEEAEDPGE